jgi:hypothetical protein
MLRLLAVVLTALLAATALPGSALAANPNVDVDLGGSGDQFVVKGAIVLEPGERAGTLVTIDGPITIPRGAVVREDVLAVDGTVRIAGTVRGDVVTLGGRAILEPTAVVGGGVSWVSERPRVAPGARVADGVDQVDADVGSAVPFLASAWWWVAVSLSTLALGLLALWLAPRAGDAIATQMRTGWGPAIGVGFVLALLLPFAAVLAIATLVGVPFGVGLLLSALPLAALGYVTGAWVLGRLLVAAPRSRALAFLAGWAILRGIAALPVVGLLGFLVASVFGLGALAWTTWRARGIPGGPEAPVAPAL